MLSFLNFLTQNFFIHVLMNIWKISEKSQGFYIDESLRWKSFADRFGELC